jgi:hypothetical protein
MENVIYLPNPQEEIKLEDLDLLFERKEPISRNIDIYVKMLPENILIGLIHYSRLDKEYSFVQLKALYLQYTEATLKSLLKIVERANNYTKPEKGENEK